METDTSRWLYNFGDRIKILIRNNLHAKCFLNEKSAVVTSMNLYDYSMINNIEFGVYFEKDSNSENFKAIYEEILDMGIETVENENSKIKVDLKDLLRDFGTISMSLGKEKNGRKILMLFSGPKENNHVPIKISPEIKFQSVEELDKIKELISGNDLYLIENNEEKYFAFYSKNLKYTLR